MPPPVRHVPPSAIAAFIDRDRIDRLLTPFVADAADRAFVVRCLLDEGPAHHRGANFILLALLGELTRGGALPAGEETIAVPMRLPPEVAGQVAEGAFPLGFPKHVLEKLAPEGTPAFEAMVDCLTDGPPQHSLANAATLCLLSVLMARVGTPK